MRAHTVQQNGHHNNHPSELFTFCLHNTCYRRRSQREALKKFKLDTSRMESVAELD